jgi:hypothetical protein
MAASNQVDDFMSLLTLDGQQKQKQLLLREHGPTAQVIRGIHGHGLSAFHVGISALEQLLSLNQTRVSMQAIIMMASSLSPRKSSVARTVETASSGRSRRRSTMGDRRWMIIVFNL